MLGFMVSNAFGASVRVLRNVPQNYSVSDTSTDSTTSETAHSARGARVQPVASSSVAARSATRTSVRSAVAKPSAVSNVNINVSKSNERISQNSISSQSGTSVVARSATSNKSKFTDVMEDTAMPQDCVSAYNGCMDSLCILPNTSGGRCRCDDRIFKFDTILEKMQRFDRYRESVESYGLERLQLGSKAEDVYSLADDTLKDATKDQAAKDVDLYKELSGKKKVEYDSFDMSGISIGSLLDVSDLESSSVGRSNTMKDDITGKQGKVLRDYANKLCVNKMPDKCEDYVPMLQALYTKQIGGDCTGYENSLKSQFRNTEDLKQKSQSNIRSAALVRYNIDNKYNKGQCIKEFKRCMQEEDKCGPGFKNCVYDPVVFSAKKSKPKKKTIKLGTSTTIEIDEATYAKVEQNKSACEPVLDSCVKERDNVWESFLAEVAGELRSAELRSESDRLQNCSKEILECITNAARETGEKEGEVIEEGTENWDRFTSNPEIFEQTCKVEIDHCAATNDVLAANIVEYVKYILDARRVDSCTKAVRNCYQTKCGGKDYHLCAGKEYDDLLSMCTDDIKGESDTIKLQCSRDKNDMGIKDYVKRVARGVFLEISQQLSELCRNAVTNAMTNVCGGTTYCDADTAGLDYTDIMQALITYSVCPGSEKDSADCITNVSQIPSDINTDRIWSQDIKVTVNPATIHFDGEKFTGGLSSVLDLLNTDYKRIKADVDADETVKNCVNGNMADTGAGFGGNSDGVIRYPNLTDSVSRTIADSVLKVFVTQYYAYMADVSKNIEDIYAEINKQKVKGCGGYEECADICTDLGRADELATVTGSNIDYRINMTSELIKQGDVFVCKITRVDTFPEKKCTHITELNMTTGSLANPESYYCE